MEELPIKYVKDKDGKFFPVTSTKAVFNENNRSVDEIILETISSDEVVGTDTENTPLDNYLTKAILLDYTHPINSVYASVSSTRPEILFGGKWQEIPEGYALWTTSTAKGDAGSTISSGLPNITGHIRFSKYGTPASTDDYGGAITRLYEETEGYFNQGTDTGNYRNKGFSLDASKSNSIYGKSDIVQPPAYKLYAWIRIA